MIELLEKTTVFGNHFSRVERDLAAIGPQWLHDARRAALAMWEAAGWPTLKDEEWKYTSLRDAAETTWSADPRSASGRLTSSPPSANLSQIEGIRIDFANGSYAPDSLNPATQQPCNL